MKLNDDTLSKTRKLSNKIPCAGHEKPPFKFFGQANQKIPEAR